MGFGGGAPASSADVEESKNDDGDVVIQLRGPPVQIKRFWPKWKKGDAPLGYSDIADPKLVEDFFAFWQVKARARFGRDCAWCAWLEV